MAVEISIETPLGATLSALLQEAKTAIKAAPPKPMLLRKSFLEIDSCVNIILKGEV
jgi:hypothetical protein